MKVIADYPARFLLNLLSGPPMQGKMQILMYHRVLPEPDPLQPSEPCVTQFRWQMELLKEHFNVLPVSEAIDLLSKDTLPPRSACVTFDDGYADNLSIALPVMAELKIRPTVFVASGYLDGGIMFNDVLLETVRQCREGELSLQAVGLNISYRLSGIDSRLAAYRDVVKLFKYLPERERRYKSLALADEYQVALPENLMLTSNQLRILADSQVDIGAHTVNHPILKLLNNDEARAEILQSRRSLEDILGKSVSLFAYPNGVPGQDYATHHPQMVRDLGFAAAVSTKKGVSTASTDRFQLRRFTPWDKTPSRFLLRLVRNYL